MEKAYIVGLYEVEGIGLQRLKSLLEIFHCAEEAWKASPRLLQKAEIPPDVIRNIIAKREKIDPVEHLLCLQKRGIRVILNGEGDYPELLSNIYDPPPVLYVRGEVDHLSEQVVAVIGARRATPYGLTMAEKLGRELADEGFWVVSGMARGIDSAAHRGALCSGGKTIAVLGCGLDVVYPRENRRLMEEIAGNGAVISEFPLGTKPVAGNFPRRNRVISGLSKGVVVVEAQERSGTSITVNFALEQGREVFAVPGPVTAKLSRGPNGLIKTGAKLVENAGDILEELGFFRATPQKGKKIAHLLGGLSDNEKALYGLLSLEPIQGEDLIRRSGLTGQEVIACLLRLELKGLVKQMPGLKYVLATC